MDTVIRIRHSTDTGPRRPYQLSNPSAFATCRPRWKSAACEGTNERRLTMDSTRFDRISQLFGKRRLTRRQAVTASAVGIAAALGTQHSGLAQEATPAATPVAD
jgi:hypothetical protein